MAAIELHQQVMQAVASVFGYHPHQVEIQTSESTPVVTIIYQDYLTPKTLYQILSTCCCLSVQWNFERSMSLSLRHLLLEELYHHPEYLIENKSYHYDVRSYVLDRFSTTDYNVNIL